jgi:hypothetical protein
MNNRLACLLTAGLTLAAVPSTVISASPLRHPVGDLEILVDGEPQPSYEQEGRWYVEARKGREYAIRLHNPHAVRIAVALSVDGLNTIDARETTAAAARKWVLAPYETVTISGWQTSQSEARRFEFTTEAGSYGQALGRTANLGVISAVFFKERVQVVRPEITNEDSRRQPSAAAPAPAERESVAGLAKDKSARDEYAATGMGRRTGHAVEQVWLNLEDTPDRTVSIRYEFRQQLVRLGILPPAGRVDPLERRERARGFVPDFCPVPAR